MSPHPLRRLLAACAVATAVTCTWGAASAVAAPAFTPSPYVGPIRADVTGDGTRDTVVLGYLGDRQAAQCVAQLRSGRRDGSSAPPVFVPLPVRGQVAECPDLGTVLTGPTPSANRLAVGFFCCPPTGDAPLVQVFSLVSGIARYRTGTSDAEFQPSRIASQDFDGDGWGDLWENTDQGSGFTALLTHGSGFRPLASLPSGWFAGVQFADLNHNPGTDMLLTNAGASRTPAAAVVVDGRTGATQTLVTLSPDSTDGVGTYRFGIVDLDHDTYADLRVDGVDGENRVVDTAYFRNASQGGRWYFTPAPAPRV